VSQLVILDREAVRVLGDPAHPKHRRVVSHVQVVARRKRCGGAVQLVVPMAVRIEAGWDRTSAAWAFLNRLRIADVPLDQTHSNAAAAIRNETAVPVADAHLGAVIQSSLAAQVTVVTGDPEGVRLVTAGRSVTIVAL
jgi:hypothetical protein